MGRQRESELYAKAQGFESDYTSGVGALKDTASAAYNAPITGFDELYGGALDRLKAGVRSSTAGQRRNLSRLAMATGDVSGSTASAMNQTEELANKQVGAIESDFATKYADFSEGAKRFNVTRGDDLTRYSTDAMLNLRDRAQSDYQNERQLRIQKEQAKKQFWADLAGGVLGAGATVLGGPVGGMLFNAGKKAVG